MFGIFCVPEAVVFDSVCDTAEKEKGTVSTISDQCLYGMTCRIIEELEDRYKIITGTGYRGYIHKDVVITVDEKAVNDYLSQDLFCVDASALDVMNIHAVSGVPYLTLFGGAIIAAADDPDPADGWTRVKLLDGREGYVTSVHLSKMRYSEEYLFCDTAAHCALLTEASKRSREAKGGKKDFDFKAFLEEHYSSDEEAFRDTLVKEAFKYLGTQYRWGGRSRVGLDCSGLVSMSYLHSGVVIYRDAAIVDGFPIEKLPVTFTDGVFDICNVYDGSIRKGDALYFPGHIAMYIGNGEYIHSTAHAGDNGVVVNSLLPDAPNYREDLIKLLYAVGGLR